MNKIVRDSFPVSKLPPELRSELAGSNFVRLTMEPLPSTDPKFPTETIKHRSKLRDLGIVREEVQPISLKDIRSIARPVGTTPVQAVQRIRRSRAERGDR